MPCTIAKENISNTSTVGIATTLSKERVISHGGVRVTSVASNEDIIVTGGMGITGIISREGIVTTAVGAAGTISCEGIMATRSLKGACSISNKSVVPASLIRCYTTMVKRELQYESRRDLPTAIKKGALSFL